MTSNCSVLGYSGGASDFCLPITITKDTDEFTVDTAWIAGAFFLGLIIGGVLTMLCVRPFLAAWAKKKRQDEEEMLMEGGISVAAEPLSSDKKKKAFKSIEAVPLDSEGRKAAKKKSSRFKRRKKVKDDDGGATGKVELDEALCRGMVDVISQTNVMSAEVEMGEQDMQAIVAMERSQDQEKETLLLKMLEFLLRKKAEKRMITDNFCDNFMKKTEQDMRDTRHMIDREKEEEEEKLRNDNKLSKDPQALESEMQVLQTKFNNKQSKLQRDAREKIRADLIKSSGMSEEEVEGEMEKLMAQMSNLEEKLGNEQSRQRRVLEERLAKRRQVVEYQGEVEKEKEETRTKRGSSMREVLSINVLNGHLLERQNDELTAQHENNLSGLYQGLGKEYNLQWGDLSEELHDLRQAEMQKLMGQQAQERAMFLKKTQTATSLSELVKGYHDLLSGQHGEQERLSDELDEKDVLKMEELNKWTLKAEEKGSLEEAKKAIEGLETVSDVSHNEAIKFLEKHKQSMDDHKERQQRDKQAMLQRLQEKLQQRLVNASEAEVRDAQEQTMLCKEQSQTMQKVLASNLDLSEEAKDKILKQHEQNMQALSNQLQRSKNRQQKSLEMKLNQRKARMLDLRKKQEDLKKNSKQMSEKERDKLEAELEQQVLAEERKFEEARQAAVAELRRQLAAETAEAIRAQDEEIGLLIARLQCGQARRKAILQRQDKTMNELHDQLEKRVSPDSGAHGSTMTDQLLQQHYNTVEHLNTNMQRQRESQERQVAEKVKLMKRQKEQAISVELEEEAQQDFTDTQQRGAGYASLALMQSFLEQRHQRAISELETQMTAELEKEKHEINHQMEIELQKELQNQRQSLLTNLAAVSDLSHKELEDAVDAATSGKTSEKQAKKLAKDLKVGIERAKTSMGMDHSGAGDRQGLDMRRARSDMGAGDIGELGAAPTRRPASGKRFMKKKAAFAHDIDEADGDDDF